MQELRQSTIADLKQWLGMPEVKRVAQPDGVMSAIHSLVPRNRVADFHTAADIIHPLPDKLTVAHTTVLYAAAHQYVMTDYPLEPEVVTNLNKWIVTIKPSILIFHYLDITVAAGAKLVLQAGNSVLFARTITVEKTGSIVTKASVVKIDCAGFKGN